MGRFVHDRILRRCRTIISDSLRNEIKLTYDEILSETLDDDELKNLGTELIKGNLPTINSRIPLCPLAVSYDMGWNKRAGGRVYNSLSGHGFLIGCRSGKVIEFGVLKKNVQPAKNIIQHNKTYLSIDAM